MTLEMDIGQLIGWATGLMGLFVGVVTGLVKLLLNQFETRLGERFETLDKASEAASQQWEQSFAKLVQRQDKDADAIRQLEKSFLRFQAELPLEYVRREDWVRGQSVIEAKLDGLALRFENVLLKGARHD